MRQGITTRYMGPTNSSGARVKATARKGRIYSDGTRDKALLLTDHWDHASNIEANHTRVAQLLATKLGWRGLWVGAGAPDEFGFHYVNLGPSAEGEIRGNCDLGQEGLDWFYCDSAA